VTSLYVPLRRSDNYPGGYAGHPLRTLAVVDLRPCPSTTSRTTLWGMTYDIALTELSPATACHLRVRTSAHDIAASVGGGLQDLYEFAAAAHAVPAGPPQLAYPGPVTDGDFELDLYLPISGEVAGRAPVDIVDLPGGPAASTVHRGAYDEIPAAYEAVFEWVHSHGRTPGGPPRELYLTGPDEAESPEDYLTEVVVPLLQR
jgi:effector-binding domain-containing protein